MITDKKKTSVLSKHSCSLCDNNDAAIFFEIHEMPTQDGIFSSSKEEALNTVKGDIILSYCENCGYICNEGHVDEKIRFDTYDFSLSKSPSFRKYVDEATDKLIAKYDLHGKNILDVGCGEGYFLREICRKGNNQGIGIDPGFNHQSLERRQKGSVNFLREYYSRDHAHLQVDFLICRLVIDLLNDPFGFLKTVRENLENQRDCIVYFEVPNTDFNLDELCIWNLVYEHKSWYTPETLSYFFELCGFETLDIYPCWKNEFLAIEARPKDVIEKPVPTLRQALQQKTERLKNALAEIKLESTKKLQYLQSSNRSVVAWGAGARAVSFFNLFEEADYISHIVDINAKRQGKYLPGTGQLVIKPEELPELAPDCVLITNPTYAEEIKGQVRELGLEPEFWVL